MDLSFKPEHESFRQEVREFLDNELTDELREAGKLTACLLYTSDAADDMQV